VDDTPRGPKAADPTPIAELAIDPATPLYRVRPFALLFATRLAANISNHMLAVAVGYQVYELTDSAFNLGLIGLVQFLPPLLLMLLAGQAADRYNRRLVLRACFAVELCTSGGLLAVTLAPHPSVAAIFALVFINACARTFEQPTVQSLVPVMAPRVLLGRAIAAYVSAGKLSVLIGPSLGGVLYIFGPEIVYGACTLMVSIATLACIRMPDPPTPAERPKVSWDTLVAGFRFIWRCPAILGAMSFDLIATLFGGVQALLPIYARDILDIGAWGSGLLRSAPALGALLAAAVLTRFPIRRHAGLYSYAGFTVYGAMTIVFGLSENVALSIGSLMLVGAGDMMSSVVRQTLIQVTTPDPMRGRVAAVNSLFIGTSGQLGSFRAGIMAAWIGAVGAVVIGGAAALATVALWLWLFPALRRVDRADEAQPY